MKAKRKPKPTTDGDPLGAPAAGLRKFDLRAPHRRVPTGLDELIAREHTRVAKLAREVERARRRLARARMRYSVLTRLAADESKRNLGGL